MTKGNRGPKFKFTVAYESGPVAEQNLDRALDILAIWMARLYKKEHPEEFNKRQIVEDSSATKGSSNDPDLATKRLDAQEEMEYHSEAIQMISNSSADGLINDQFACNKEGEERCLR